jgi:hypothetical protein
MSDCSNNRAVDMDQFLRRSAILRKQTFYDGSIPSLRNSTESLNQLNEMENCYNKI